jgi:hypothetical protein
MTMKTNGYSGLPTLREADAESRETIRGYVEDVLNGRDYEPDASDFITEFKTPSVRWDYDAVEAEIERILPEEKLRADIRQYVAEGGHDAFSFASLAYPRHNNVSGREIQRIIDTEREALK